MIEIGKHILEFKKGVYDTCKLFKTLYSEEKNILLDVNNTLYINNISQLLDFKTKKSDAYIFGIQFTLDNIKNFRDNICINPILYILALETLLTKITELRELEKYDFSKVNSFLNWYYQESNLHRAIVPLDSIYKLFPSEAGDDFLHKVIEVSYVPGNVIINESKTNTLVKDRYYRMKGNFISGKLYGQNHKIFLTPTLNHDLMTRLLNLNLDILVVTPTIEIEIENSRKLSVIKIPQTTYVQRYIDICLLTGFGRGAQNLDVLELNSFSFGEVKEFKFIEGELLFSVDKYLLANDPRLDSYNKKDSLSRYYMLQGKNTVIYVTEEYLEKVRCLVSTIKSLNNSGVFYNEVKTLKLIIERFKDEDAGLTNFIDELLTIYLALFKLNHTVIEEVLNNRDLTKNFDVKTGEYSQEELFSSLDYYLNIFGLLASNVQVLSKLY